MRTLHLIMASMMFLSGCSSEVDDAERELAIIEEAGGNVRDRCAAYEKLASAHLKAQNAERYKHYKFLADSTCLVASQGGGWQP